jgi:hypothetical protein
MVIILFWATTIKKKKKTKNCLSYNKTTFIGVDRTNVWSKTVYFPNPSHDVSWSPAAADSSAGVAHQGQCQREFGILLCSFIIQPVLCSCVWEKA